MAVGTSVAVEDLEPFRRELTGYCYRMLGSGSEAEDAVQETMLRAWRAAESFEGRASVRSWLYRIATNVCIDMGRQVQRRARPMEMGPPSPPEESRLGPLLPESTWITPIADGRIEPAQTDPAEIAEHRESIRLAFVAALQHLPARQRAALILCEVLRWQASEVAALLGTSVAAVNSALQRARATMATLPGDPASTELEEPDAQLLRGDVEAFEHYDIERLVTLLREDAVMSMPPFAMWIRARRTSGGSCWSPCRASAGGRSCCPCGRTGARRSGSTSPIQGAAALRGASRCWRSPPGRSPGFIASSTPSCSSPCGLPVHLPA